MPVTVTNFPIDPTRWYLLGQVEYYFSVQNLCSDFWLRKQMDNRGWVPVSVIASFNRVRHLTYDVGLVRDVMSLSVLVEVHGDKVRLRNRHWMPFILPDAAPSDIPELMEQQPLHYNVQPAEINQSQEPAAEEGEDEDEVVFVMGKEGEERRSTAASWGPTEDAEQHVQS
ncbi:winged helix DNA-binding domain-containing protein [Ramaria rubella]|nr:winged helix DNA-binding domain-containing protein [Ramaria rubella]